MTTGRLPQRRARHSASLTVRHFFWGGEEKQAQAPVQQKPLEANAAPHVDEGSGRVTTVHSEEELNAVVNTGADTVVKLAFTWCRPCKGFWPKYIKYADVYSNTRFLKIVGNENESCKHYAREVLQAKISPMFAVYSKGELVRTWHGANNGRFIKNMEEFLPSAKELAAEREAAVVADTSLAAT